MKKNIYYSEACLNKASLLLILAFLYLCYTAAKQDLRNATPACHKLTGTQQEREAAVKASGIKNLPVSMLAEPETMLRVNKAYSLDHYCNGEARGASRNSRGGQNNMDRDVSLVRGVVPASMLPRDTNLSGSVESGHAENGVSSCSPVGKPQTTVRKTSLDGEAESDQTNCGMTKASRSNARPAQNFQGSGMLASQTRAATRQPPNECVVEINGMPRLAKTR